MVAMASLCIFIVSAVGVIIGIGANESLTIGVSDIIMAISAFVYFEKRIEELEEKLKKK